MTQSSFKVFNTAWIDVGGISIVWGLRLLADGLEVDAGAAEFRRLIRLPQVGTHCPHHCHHHY